MASRVAKEVESQQKQLVAKISQLTEILQIQTWDVLLIGDGSGTGWQQGIGWASTLIDRASMAAKMFHGGISAGTISLGELLPYLHALLWFFSDDGPGKSRLAACRNNVRPLFVHIVTDSSYVATCGNNPDSRRGHLPLWIAMDAFTQMGVSLTYHHWGRKQLSLNILADEVARQARLQAAAAYPAAITELARKYPGVSPEATVYDFFLWD